MGIIKSLQITKAGEGVEKREHFYAVGGNISWCSHYRKQSLENGNIELPDELTIPLHPEKTTIQKYTCTPIFVAAPFTIASTWKQPKCPSTDECIKLWYIYTNEHYSAMKKNSC